MRGPTAGHPHLGPATPPDRPLSCPAPRLYPSGHRPELPPRNSATRSASPHPALHSTEHVLHLPSPVRGCAALSRSTPQMRGDLTKLLGANNGVEVSAARLACLSYRPNPRPPPARTRPNWRLARRPRQATGRWRHLEDRRGTEQGQPHSFSSVFILFVTIRGPERRSHRGGGPGAFWKFALCDTEC